MNTLTNGDRTTLPLSAMASLVLDAPSTALMDLETRTTVDDHQDLSLWLRLLACTIRVEHQVRDRLRREFETTLPQRFDFDGAARDAARAASGCRSFSRTAHGLQWRSTTGITDQLEREHLVVRVLSTRQTGVWSR